jgi:hypothetical protein
VLIGLLQDRPVCAIDDGCISRVSPSSIKQWKITKKNGKEQRRKCSFGVNRRSTITQQSNLTSLHLPFIYHENCHSHISLMSPAGVVGDLPQVVSRKYRARYLFARGRGFES